MICRCHDGESAAIGDLQVFWMFCRRDGCSVNPMLPSIEGGLGAVLCRHCTDSACDASPVIGIGRACRQVQYDTT